MVFGTSCVKSTCVYVYCKICPVHTYMHVYLPRYLSEALENIATEQEMNSHLWLSGVFFSCMLFCICQNLHVCLEQMHCILSESELLNSMATKHSKCQCLLVIPTWSYSGVSIQYTVVCCP